MFLLFRCLWDGVLVVGVVGGLCLVGWCFVVLGVVVWL